MRQSELPPEVVSYFIDRKALLWVCQRYELTPGAQPHSYASSPSEVRLLYRSEVNDIDRALFGFYWEAIWVEGASGLSARAARTSTDNSKRPIAELSRAEDATSPVDTLQFFPIYELAGILDDSLPEGSRYGTLSSRRREHVAWLLRDRLAGFAFRLLVVVGVREVADLDPVWETLTEAAAPGLQVLIIWEGQGDPKLPSADPLGLPVWTWNGSPAEFIEELDRIGAPAASEVPEWSLRLGNGSITLEPSQSSRILHRFSIINERDLTPPRDVTIDTAAKFLRGDVDDWRGYSAKFVFERRYAVRNTLLSEYVRTKLHEVSTSGGIRPENRELILPAEGGAGSTTLLRSVAWECARKGYPTLVLRPGQVDVDPEELAAFALTVSERGAESELRETAFLIVCDVEHDENPGVDAIVSIMRARGRPTVVLRAIPLSRPRTPSGYREILPPLNQVLLSGEIEALASHFADVVRRYALEIDIPSLAEWYAYQARQELRYPGAQKPENLFWVALQFFLLRGGEFRSDVATALAAWIARRSAGIYNTRVEPILNSVAVLSSLRLPAPVWATLRPVFGSRFSSDFTDVLRSLEEILVWEDAPGELESILRFRHPAMAEIFLTERDLNSLHQRLNELRPMLEQLSPGSASDVWLAESIATEVIAPRRGSEGDLSWEKRLEVLAWLPRLLTEQNPTILHHWARTLYTAAEVIDDPALDREALYQEAVNRLLRAVDLPRRPVRNENPSHLWNTLGTAYVKWAQSIQQSAKQEHVAALWENAIDAFDTAVRLGHGQNTEALFAYADRLLQRIRVTPSILSKREALSSALDALGYLDQAEEMLEVSAGSLDDENTSFIAQHRFEALTVIREEAAMEFLESLRDMGDDLAYYCEARMHLADGAESTARSVLESAHRAGIPLRPSAIKLLLRLLEGDAEGSHQFEKLLELYKLLEARAGDRWNALDRFKAAVLCYQTERFEEGRDRFRRLRELTRERGILPPRVQAEWRSSTSPFEPRVTIVEVTRWISHWRAHGYVADMRQEVLLRPQQFAPPASKGERRRCLIRFEFSGPMAIPERFGTLKPLPRT